MPRPTLRLARTACFLAALTWPFPAFAASVDLQPAVAKSGDRVGVFAALDAMASRVFGVQIDLTPAAALSVAARPDGRPMCRSFCLEGFPPWPLDSAGLAAGDGVGGPASPCQSSFFAFQPPGCMPGTNCTGVRYLEFLLGGEGPIADGGTVIECTVDVAPDAAPGASFDIACAAELADEDGEPIPATCTNGVVDVLCPGDCDADGAVSVAEVLLGLRILHGETPLSACPTMDYAGRGSLSIGDLVRARNSALGDCRR